MQRTPKSLNLKFSDWHAETTKKKQNIFHELAVTFVAQYEAD